MAASSAHYAHAISMAVVVIGISYFSLILGELVPKRIALSHPERIAAALRPLHARDGAGRRRRSNGCLSATTDLILRLLPVHGEPPAVTDEEIGFMLREGVAAGHIPLGRNRDRRDGAAARRPPDQRGDDAAHPDRVSRPRRPPRRRPAGASATAPIRAFRWCRAARTSLPASSRSRICSPPRWPAQPFDLRAGAAPAAVPAEHRDRAARARDVQEQRRADGAGGRRIRRPRRAGDADRHPRGAGRRHPRDRRHRPAHRAPRRRHLADRRHARRSTS